MRFHRPIWFERRPGPALAATALLVAAPWIPDAGAQSRWSLAEDEVERPVLIRLLPPLPGRQAGAVRVETLLTDPEVHNVVFLLDGEVAARRRSPPWAATLRLASPPREQLLRAEARDADDRLLAADELRVNRQRQRLAVSLRSIEAAPDGLVVRAGVSLPDEVELERLEVFLNQGLERSYTAAELDRGGLDGVTFADGELAVALETAQPGPQDFVRVVARLADGRAVEDAGLVSGRQFTEQVDVRLVQLQVVVTNKRGLPMRGLTRENFRISENGRDRQAAGLFAADDVALLLGLALDSSGSMHPIWPQTRQAASSFLLETLRDRDEGFLVDFDTRLRLVQARTPDRTRLQAALDGLRPEGGTALYDSILFSLLQFDGQQGRRGLVVMTDGYDVDSQADPRRAVEFGKRLGVPIYVVALESRGGGRVPSRGISTSIDDPAAAVQALRLVTDPTGGRLYRAASLEQVTRAFALINAELRNQYVLTYYTDTPPQPGSPPLVRIEASGQKGLRAKVVFGADQVY
jgi:Ca-activated chloride channel family protein